MRTPTLVIHSSFFRGAYAALVCCSPRKGLGCVESSPPPHLRTYQARTAGRRDEGPRSRHPLPWRQDIRREPRVPTTYATTASMASMIMSNWPTS